MAVNPIPDPYHTVTPHLIIKRAAAAIDYYKRAFGATELVRVIGRTELRIGNSMMMLADEHAERRAIAAPAASVRRS